MRPDVLSLSVIGAAGAVLVLSIALAAVATGPRPYVLVPAAVEPVELLPDQVPDEAARSFALLYVMMFDNYTPATIEASAAALKARVAPRCWSEVADALDRRVKVAVEGRMSSHCVAGKTEINRPGDGTIVAEIAASRRLFIADKLSKHSVVTYRLVLEPCAPTASNPNGLAVVAQGLEERHEVRK